jgi:competence protein ComEA
MGRFTLGVALLVAALWAAPGDVAAQSAPPAAKAATAAVDLNTATAAQLETLPGIGARTAERIIEYREKNGGFKKVEELMNVRGVGEKSFLKLKPLVTVTPPKSERAGTRQP